METVRVAVVQDSSVVFDLRACLEKVHDLTSQAAAQGARIALFPEAFVSGYPKGLDFGARVGSRTESGRNDFLRYYESAIDVPGQAVEVLGAAAKDNGVFLIVGVIERDMGTLYCTALFISPAGTLLGKHRKLMPTGMERLIWGCGDGSTMPVFDTPLGKIGAAICWENYMPMYRMYLYSNGVQIYCAPTADDRDTWLHSMRHIAVEGRCFVLSSCQYLLRKDCPDDYPCVQGDDPQTVLMKGGSCIVGPFGDILAGPAFEGPAILTADINLQDIARGKFDLDVSGHYSRPDVFQLQVNVEQASPTQTRVGSGCDPSTKREESH
jgi:nitrilase